MKANKIFLFFILFFVLFFFSFYFFIKSNYFSGIVASFIVKEMKKNTSLNLTYKDFKINFFPVGMEISNLEIKYTDFKNKNISADLDLNNVSIEFNTFDLLASKFSIKQIKISDTSIKINGLLEKKYDEIKSPINLEDLKSYLSLDFSNKYLKDKKSSNFNGLKLKVIKEALSTLPVVIREVALKKIILNADGYLTKINNLNFVNNRDEIKVLGEFENIDVTKIEVIKSNVERVNFNLKLDEKKLTIDEFIIIDKGTSVNFSGKILNISNKFEKWIIESDLKSTFDLKYFQKIEQLKGILGETYGRGRVIAKIFGKVDSPDFSLKIFLNDFSLKYLMGDSASFEINKTDKRYFISKFECGYKSGQVYLVNKSEIYNSDQKSFLPTSLILNLSNADVESLLHVLKQEVGMLRTNLTGQIIITFEKEILKVFFPEEVKVSSLKVITDEGIKLSQAAYVDLQKFSFLKSEFKFNFENKKLSLNLSFAGEKFSGKILGFLNDKQIDINTKDFHADFGKMGKFGGQEIFGEGLVDLNVNGPLSQPIMSLKSAELRNFNYLGYKFDQAKIDIDINLTNGNLVFNKIYGKTGKSDTILSGAFTPRTLGIDLKGELRESLYKDILTTLEPLTKNLTYLNQDVIGTIDSKFRLSGHTKPGELLVEGSFSSANLNIFSENLNGVRSDFKFQNKKFEITKITFKKNDAPISGSLSFDNNDDSLKYFLEAKNVVLSEIQSYQKLPFGLNGVTSLRVVGGSKKGKHFGNGSLKITNGTISNIRVADSKASYLYSDNKLKFDAEMFKGGISISGILDFSERIDSREKKSSIIGFVGSNDLNLFTGLLFEHNTKLKKIRGKINSDFKASFNYYRPEILDAEFILNDFNFQRKGVSGSVRANANKVIIKNGKIDIWDILVKGNKFNLGSIGNGDLNSNFKIKNILDFDASILEVFTANIKGAQGQLINQFIFQKDNLGKNLFAELSSNNLSISHSALPGQLDKVNFKISENNNHFLVESFEGTFANGKINASGDFILKSPNPEFNISFNIENSYLSFFKKSTFLVSGDGVVSGNQKPYIFSGNFILLKAQIFDELDSFSGGKNTTVVNKYIPKVVKETGPSMMKFNVSIDGLSDIQVKNSLGEMKLRGNIRLLGDTNQIKIGGQLSLVPGTGKFYFKTNDFVLSKGNVTFFSNEDTINPEILFAAKSKISEYDVELKIYGRAKKYSLELNSEPSLSQEDIFSLLTVGFTEDVSKNIGDKDRQSLTSVGIGSLIFDKFKIGQELSSSLGVKLSVAPELVESNSSLLSNKGGDASGPASRLRSTTKIKLQKNITDALDISVSSNVGGSVGQKQEMNLNYSLNKNVSVLGVYEVRTDDDTEDSLNTSSIGGDLKLKWTFK